MESRTVHEGFVICPATLASCHCRKSLHEDSDHVCICGGSWHGNQGQPDFRILSMPQRIVSG